MRNIIKKILKEDFNWASEPLDIPTDEIEQWVQHNQSTVSKYIQRLQQLEDKLPKVDWDNESELFKPETQNTLGVTQLKNDLINIYDSMEELQRGIDDLKNSEDDEY
jgi:predicted  nucleic acid-binding Zn-ribbon protein